MSGDTKVNPTRNPLMQHPNRGKRSDRVSFFQAPRGQKLLYGPPKTADVFLTNFQPSTRKKLKFDVEHIRAANPKIIYARGSAYGDKGPERDVGGFDGTAFWTRSGIGQAMSPAELEGPLSQGIARSGFDRRHVYRRRHIGGAVASRTDRRSG